MAIKNNRLKEYIYQNTSSSIRGRANGVMVRDLDFSPDYGSVSAKVWGSTGNTYTITFYGIQFGLLSSSCTCPFDHGDICKHEVAVAKEIDGFVDIPAGRIEKLQAIKQAAEEKKVAKVPSVNGIEIPFVSVQHITTALLKKYTSNYVFNDLYYFNAHVQMFDRSAENIRFSVKGHSYYKDSAVVTVTKQESFLRLLCTCKSKAKTLCIHQAQVLRYVAEEMPQLFMGQEEMHLLKNKLLAEFGFSTNDKGHEDYFTFEFKKGQLQIIPKNGIVRLSKFKDFEPLRNELFNDDRALPDRMPFLRKSEKKNKLTLAIGFAFLPNGGDSYPAIVAVPLKGNLKKDGTTLVSKIEEIYPKDLVSNTDGFSKVETDIIRKALSISSGSLHGLRHEAAYKNNINHFILTQLQELLPLLDNTLVTGVNLYDRILKKDLYPMKLSMESAELSFTVEEEDDFYVLTSHISVAGKKQKLSQAKIGNNLLFVHHKDTAHLNKSMNFSKTLAAFRSRPETRIKKDDFDSYYNEFILPLSKRYDVNINHQKPKKSRKIGTDQLKKQVYLSVFEDYIMLKPALLYKAQTFAVHGHEDILETENDSTYSLERDRAFEDGFLQEIKHLHPQFEHQQEGFFYIATEDFIENTWFLDAFETLREQEIEIFGLDKLKNIKYNVNKPNINISVNSGLDWFDVSVSVSFGDQSVSLRDLKKSVVAQDRYVQLGDGSIGILPEAWLKKYAHLFRSGTLKKDRIEVSKYQLSVIDSLYEDLDLESDMVKNHLDLKQKLRSFSSIDNVKPPVGVKAVLRDYQKEGLNWLNFLDEYGFGGCLADDMGLGKTLQVITFLQHLKKTRKTKRAHLIVVPTSLIFNWSEELKKFCPGLSILNLTGGDRSRKTDNFDEHDLVITTYGTLLRDIELLKEHQFEYVILDESQAIKNPNSKRYKAVRMLRSHNRLVMTGTPIENNTFDLYAQMTFVNPGLLGTMTNFKTEYATPVDKNKDADVAQELRQLISPFLMRRTKEQVAKELPDKTEQVLYCTMGKAQRKVYDAYRNKYRDYLMGKIEEEGLGKSKMYVLEGLTKLRQICDSPQLLSEDETYTSESIKIDELMEQVLERTGDHKMLLFSQFVSMLQLIKDRLEKEGIPFEYLDGKTRNRQEKVENFQNDTTIRVFLISLKAGGTGLNLTAADYVYLVDPWWNPAVEAQAIDRCYRIGQEKKVMAYKMICKDTIEEKIVTMQASKKQLSADIIQTDESFVKSLSKESIADLFG